MVLSGSKRTSRMSSLVNGPQGGGNKKAGLYPSTGIDSWTNVAYGNTPGHCSMTLACMRRSRPGENACVARPVGSLVVNPRLSC